MFITADFGLGSVNGRPGERSQQYLARVLPVLPSGDGDGRLELATTGRSLLSRLGTLQPPVKLSFPSPSHLWLLKACCY